MMQERLRQAQQDFNEAEVNDSFSKIPDGEYPGFISDVKIEDDKWNVLRINFEVTLTDMDHAGRKVFPNAPLAGAYIGLSKKYLKILGFDVENMDLGKLPDLLPEMMNKDVIVALVTKKNAESGKEFQSAYLNRLPESEADGMFGA